MREIPKIFVLGVQVSVINMESAVQAVEQLVIERNPSYVCVVPAHSIMECVNNPKLIPSFNEAVMSTPDGMSVVWLAKLKGYSDVERVYGPDLLLQLCEHGLEQGWKHHFLGGSEELQQKLYESLTKRFPSLVISGHTCPPFRQLSNSEDLDIVDEINEKNPDIVWIGYGSPHQEIWMHDYVHKLNAPVLIGVGAAFDFLSGNKPQAPRWIQKAGMEWLFRLISEPSRLWPRYRQYPRFVLLVLKEYIQERLSGTNHK